MQDTSRTDDDEPQDDARPSKTALKKQAHELQQLGQALAELPQERLAALPMPEALLDALSQYKQTRSHEGRRRQLQFVGKLMRNAEVEPLREAVAAAQLGGAQDSLLLHRAERWRAELVADDAALTRWLEGHSGTDVRALRGLIQRARQDAKLPPEQRHGRAWRDLFRHLKPHLQSGAEEPRTGAHDDE